MGVLDHVVNHFKESTLNNQLLVISKVLSVEHWPLVLFEYHVRVHSLVIDQSGPPLTSVPSSNSVTVGSLDKLGDAFQLSLKFICQTPDLISDVPEVPTMIIPPISDQIDEKCSTQMEVIQKLS